MRAELDALVAHLCDLSEEEFACILMSFPRVAQEVNDAARNGYCDAAKGAL